MDLSFEEWSELVALEAPSIWGLAVAKADVLDDSEPTFPSEKCTESEPAAADPSEDSRLDYSPSPIRLAPYPSLPGFNLVRPHAPIGAAVRMSPSENMAAAALSTGWISEPEIMRLVRSLPTCIRPFQHSAEDGRCACLFTTGAYIRGPMTGVMNNTITYPAVTALISAIIRSAAPDALFSTVSIILNIRSQFDPRRRRGTLGWSGDRLIAAAFHIRQPELLSLEDRRTLSHAGFGLA